jgi:phosphatidylserine/phosphatidylglycerophosphate/cardiolipin synthase-like enzyme
LSWKSSVQPKDQILSMVCSSFGLQSQRLSAGIRKGDTLLVNASKYAVRNGETSAKLLRALHKKGVHIYDCARLHAKVILLDDVAVISSGNMSGSSANGLVEAGGMTDHGSTVAGVASFIEQLLPQSKQLTAKGIAALCKIKVIRRGRQIGGHKQPRPTVTPLGNGTWLVGIRELAKDPPPGEQQLIARAQKRLQPQMSDPDEEAHWVRWAGKGRFVRECRSGDSLIRIWRSSKAQRPSVVRHN